MKSAYILASLALGLRVEARQVPADKLEARQRGGGGSGGGGACAWTGHCLGDACKTERDCDGDLDCRSGKCANPGGGGQPTVGPTPIIKTTTVYVYPSSTARVPPRSSTTARGTPRPSTPAQGVCEWTGHCIGDSCDEDEDCDLDYACRSGRCAAPGGGNTLVTSTRRVTSAPPVTRTVVQPPISTRRPTPSCGDSPLSCIGVACDSDADCGFDLIICKSGYCGL